MIFFNEKSSTPKTKAKKAVKTGIRLAKTLALEAPNFLTAFANKTYAKEVEKTASPTIYKTKLVLNWTSINSFSKKEKYNGMKKNNPKRLW